MKVTVSHDSIRKKAFRHEGGFVVVEPGKTVTVDVKGKGGVDAIVKMGFEVKSTRKVNPKAKPEPKPEPNPAPTSGPDPESGSEPNTEPNTTAD